MHQKKRSPGQSRAPIEVKLPDVMGLDPSLLPVPVARSGLRTSPSAWTTLRPTSQQRRRSSWRQPYSVGRSAYVPSVRTTGP